MIDRRFVRRLSLLTVFGLWVGLQSGVRAGDDGPPDAIPDSDLRTTADLLRGFNDAELDEANRTIPRRPEPPLRPARPRLVTATGTVFEDRNANGKRDSGEPGLPEVVVSDGEKVIRTSATGEYQFRIRVDENPHHRFVVVTRPTGFRPTAAFFHRIPFDESETKYTVHFGFARDRAAAKRKFWFITASDSQFTSIPQMIPTAKDFAQVTSAPGGPAFLATAGDLTMNGSQFEWDMYDRIRRSSKIPVYEGFGGHDGNCLDPRCTVSFEQRIGPPYYSWNYGGVHFIQFVTETSYLRSTAQLRQRDWMTADLKALPAGMPVIAISHYPLSASWFDQRKAEGINVICQIGAHYHVVHAGSRRGTPVLNSAPARGHDWGAYSRTYRWVFISPEGVRSQLRVAGQYKRLRVVAPGPQAVSGRQPLVVLAYDTALWEKLIVAHVVALRFALVWCLHPGRWRLEVFDIPLLTLLAWFAASWTMAINPVRSGLEVIRVLLVVVLYAAVARTYRPSFLGPWTGAIGIALAVVSFLGVCQYLGPDSRRSGRRACRVRRFSTATSPPCTWCLRFRSLWHASS